METEDETADELDEFNPSKLSLFNLMVLGILNSRQISLIHLPR